jgi:hypothetical protein
MITAWIPLSKHTQYCVLFLAGPSPWAACSDRDRQRYSQGVLRSVVHHMFAAPAMLPLQRQPGTRTGVHYTVVGTGSGRRICQAVRWSASTAPGSSPSCTAQHSCATTGPHSPLHHRHSNSPLPPRPSWTLPGDLTPERTEGTALSLLGYTMYKTGTRRSS